MNKVNLVVLATKFIETGSEIKWSLGDIYISEGTPQDLSMIISHHGRDHEVDAWLFFDITLGFPEPDLINVLLATPADIWHAGLLLGTIGAPELINTVHPNWLLNCDADSTITSTSWRMSFRCSLIRSEVIKQLGFIESGYGTLDGAALELGHRYIRNGAIMQYVPDLVDTGISQRPLALPFEEQLLFIKHRFGERWCRWALFRAALSGQASLPEAITAWRNVREIGQIHSHHTYLQRPIPHGISSGDHKVSIIIPTINRYPYLRTLLSQLETQTIKPYEIFVIDQTPERVRDTDLQRHFLNLPLIWIYQNKAGQCTARNSAIQQAKGNFFLFLDDDEEVSDHLIEEHLATIEVFGGTSSGVVWEPGTEPLAKEQKFLRCSDVFPTGNTMVKRETLFRSGLFDLAYDYGARADGDLGMRVHLSGELMILNPNISILHHRAPQGGLRDLKARIITRESSRKSIQQRHLPSVTEVYLIKRYFSPLQVRERLWISVLGTFSIRGTKFQKVLKSLFSAFLIPDTIWRLWRVSKLANNSLKNYPKIPTINELE